MASSSEPNTRAPLLSSRWFLCPHLSVGLIDTRGFRLLANGRNKYCMRVHQRFDLRREL